MQGDESGIGTVVQALGSAEPRDEQVRFPPGRFVQLLPRVFTEHGGLTASSLQRARALYQRAGVEAPIVTLDFNADYHRIRAQLRSTGQLVGPVELINLHERLRDVDLTGLIGDHPAPGADDLGWLERAAPSVGSIREDDSQGRLWRLGHPDRVLPEIRRFDYFRADGSRYLTELAMLTADGSLPSYRVLVRDAASRVIAELPARRELHRLFLQVLADQIAPAQPLFVVVDGKRAAHTLIGFRHPRIYLIPVVHNGHLEAPQRYDSPLRSDRRRLIENLDAYDGVVFLTPRQAADVRARAGDRSNLFVVPHAVRELPDLPPHADREAHTCVMLSRLGPTKQVDHAIRAFPQVLAAVPDARLEIYGTGTEARALQAVIEELELTGSVELMGYRPDARQRLTQVAATLLTSRFEGQPLTVLESLAAGCPVISYDITYGPADLIDDGVQGFLIPPEDTDRLAVRIIEVLTRPGLAERMGRAGRRRAETLYRESDLVRRWGEVFGSVAARRARRTELRSMTVPLTDHGWAPDRTYQVSVRLAVQGRVPVQAAADARVRFRLTEPGSGWFIDVPAECRRGDGSTGTDETPGTDQVDGTHAYGSEAVEGTEHTLIVDGTIVLTADARLDLERAGTTLGPGRWALSVGLTWNNSHLESPIAWHPGGDRHAVLARIGEDGELEFQAGTQQSIQQCSIQQ
jgi:poly(glycerol-phosphate) alpha-glucosyltransferase